MDAFNQVSAGTLDQCDGTVRAGVCGGASVHGWVTFFCCLGENKAAALVACKRGMRPRAESGCNAVKLPYRFDSGTCLTSASIEIVVATGFPRDRTPAGGKGGSAEQRNRVTGCPPAGAGKCRPWYRLLPLQTGYSPERRVRRDFRIAFSPAATRPPLPASTFLATSPTSSSRAVPQCCPGRR